MSTGVGTYKNKKVLLRDRKRHTARVPRLWGPPLGSASGEEKLFGGGGMSKKISGGYPRLLGTNILRLRAVMISSVTMLTSIPV